MTLKFETNKKKEDKYIYTNNSNSEISWSLLTNANLGSVLAKLQQPYFAAKLLVELSAEKND